MGTSVDKNKNELKHEGLVSDASYNKRADSKEGLASGALSGALISGLAEKALGLKQRKHIVGNLSLGATVGGVVGEHQHQEKIKAKRRAKAELLNKTSSVDVAMDAAMGGIAGTIGRGKINRIPGSGSRIPGALIGSGMSVGAGVATREFLPEMRLKDAEGKDMTKSNGAIDGLVGGTAAGALEAAGGAALGSTNLMRNNKATRGLKLGVIRDEGRMNNRYKNATGPLSKLWNANSQETAMAHTLKGGKLLSMKTLGNVAKNGLSGGLIGAGVGLGAAALLG